MVADMTAVTDAAAADYRGREPKGRTITGPPSFFLQEQLYRFVAGISLTLCASPAASIVAPIIAGKPMHEFSIS